MPTPRGALHGSLHVLLVAESYPPSPAVGSVRPAALAQALRKAGHRVTVIRSSRFAHPFAPAPSISAETVITVETRENPIRLLARLIPWRAAPVQEAQGKGASGGSAAESVRQRLRRWVLSLFLIPDDSQGFIVPAVLAGWDRHRVEPVDLLVTTGPPFSAHLAGVVLARLLRVPWVAGFRDPWMPRDRRAAIRSELSDWLEQGLENLVLRRCQRVLAVSSSIGKSLDQKRLALGQPGGTIVALNGFPELLPPVERLPGPIRVLHAGELYLGRDPWPFLRAIAKGIHGGVFGPAGVRVIFMGSAGGAFNGRSVVDMVLKLGIADSVEVLGQLPIEECRQHMSRMDALLLLAQHQPTQIPNKLYDYLAARRPIIAYADAGGESATLLQQVGGHTLVCDATPDRDQVVMDAVRGAAHRPTGSGMDLEALAGLRTAVQMEPVVSAFEQLVGDHRRLPGHGRAGPRRLPRHRVGSGSAVEGPAPPLDQAGTDAGRRPAVSVIMPAWNVAPYIGEAVASVINQGFRDWELIVINDGAPDTAALERALAPYRERLTYLVQENRGPAMARNAGLAVARGEFVAFLDGDDAWHPDYLAGQLAHLKAHALDMVYANALLVGETLGAGRTFMDVSPSSGPVTVESLLSDQCNVITSGTVIRRECLMAVGGFPNWRAQAEDFNTWLRVALSGAQIGYHHKPLLQYRVRPGGLSGDALGECARGVAALSDARALPLGAGQRRVLERQLVRAQRRLDLGYAKQMVLAGDFAGARRRVLGQVLRYPHPRLMLVLLALWVYPGSLRLRLARRPMGPEIGTTSAADDLFEGPG